MRFVFPCFAWKSGFLVFFHSAGNLNLSINQLMKRGGCLFSSLLLLIEPLSAGLKRERLQTTRFFKRLFSLREIKAVKGFR